MKKHHSENFVKLVNEALTRVSEIAVDEVKEKLDAEEDIVLIDTREASEFESGSIPGSLHLSKGVIERDIEKIVTNPDQEVILYCGGGYRSALAAENLQRMGFKQVFSMAGGWRKWREKQYPTE